MFKVLTFLLLAVLILVLDGYVAFVGKIDGATLVLHVVYVVAILGYFYLRRLDLTNPLHIFLLLTSFSFAGAYLYYSLNPDGLYIYNQATYRIAFQCAPEHLATAFRYFVLGAVMLYVGFAIKPPAVQVKVPFTAAGPVIVPLVTLVIVVLFSIFRIYFKINLPGYNETAFRGVGFIYNPGTYVVNILIVYSAYVGIKAVSFKLLLLSFCPVVVYAVALGFVGIKSGLIYGLAMIYVCYLLLRNRGELVNFRISRVLRRSAVVLAVASFVIFNLTGYQRLLLSGSGHDYSRLTWTDFVQGLRSYLSEDDVIYRDSDILAPLKRITGISSFGPIVAFENSPGATEISLVQNMRDSTINTFTLFLSGVKIDNVLPENYFTNHILGVPREIPTTNAPSLVGAFFIYGRIFGVMLGMLLTGVVLRFFHRLAVAPIAGNDLMFILYPVFLVFILLQVLVEGTVINFLWTAVPSFLIGAALVYGLNNLMLMMAGPARRQKAAAKTGFVPSPPPYRGRTQHGQRAAL